MTTKFGGTSPLDRFWAKVDTSGDCWLWTGANVHGYGRFCPTRKEFWLAHRWIWVQENGPIADGLQLDHLCSTRSCVRVEHLEVVTPAENLRRAAAKITVCPHGHPYDEENTYTDPRGQRGCRECRRGQNREWRARSAGSKALTTSAPTV